MDTAHPTPEESIDTAYDGSDDPEELLRWAIDKFDRTLALACSFEDVVLVHMMAAIRPDVRVLAIDTGRLNDETYELAQAVRERLGVEIEWYFPT